MGNSKSKLTRGKIESVIYEAYLHVENQMIRRIEQLKKHEKSIFSLLNSGNYPPESIRTKSVSSINHLKFINGCKIVGNCLQQLKEHSEVLESAQKNPALIQQFTPSINSIIWATKPLQLDSLKQFNSMITKFFNKQAIMEAKQGKMVDRRVRLIIFNIQATDQFHSS